MSDDKTGALEDIFAELTEDDPAKDGLSEDSFTLLTFSLGQQLFGVDVRFVREVLDQRPIVPLPNAPHGVLGMIDVRARSIAIVDLAGRLGLPWQEGPDARIVVFEFEHADGGRPIGIIAEQVLRVVDAQRSRLEPLPDTMSGWSCELIEGILRTEDDNVMILRIEKTLIQDGVSPEFDFA